MFNNKTLAAFALQHPTTHDELLDVSGIGPAKAERYGDALLDMINTR